MCITKDHDARPFVRHACRTTSLGPTSKTRNISLHGSSMDVRHEHSLTMTTTRLFLPLLLLATCQAWVVPLSTAKSRHSTAVFVASTTTQCTLDGETIRGPVTPLGNFVLVKTKDTLTATEGGILLPDQVRINVFCCFIVIYLNFTSDSRSSSVSLSRFQAKERPTEGVVLAAGPGKLHPHTGVRITNPVKVGDSVLYGKFDGQPIVYNDEQCQMIRDDDVLLYYKGVTMTMENVVPCRDYVLVELSEEKLETSSGIVVAASVTKEDLPCEGIVAKVGGGRMASTGELTKSPVKVGERVKFKDYAGNDVMISGKLYSLVRMVDILCSIPEVEDGEE